MENIQIRVKSGIIMAINDLTKDITYAYTVMVGHRPNALTSVVTGHFLVEYLINRLIQTRCKDPHRLLEYSFSIKTEVVNSLNLLPEEVYRNIATLNKIRNKMVHTLQLEVKDQSFYKRERQSITKIGIKTKSQNEFVKMLVNGTLVQLRNHMIEDLSISPDYNL